MKNEKGFCHCCGSVWEPEITNKTHIFLVILEIKENMAKKGLNDKAPVRKGFH